MRRFYEMTGGKILEDRSGEGRIIFFVNPDQDDRRYLVEELKIDEHTFGSALDPDEVARLEFEPEHAALIFKRPKNLSAGGQLTFEVASVGAFVFKDKLVVVSSEEFDLFAGGRQISRCQNLPDIVIQLLDRTTSHFLGHLKAINMVAADIEKKIQGALENRYLLGLFELEKSLVYYSNAIHSNGLLVDKLKTAGARLGFSPEGIEYLDDVLVENAQCYKQADIYANILASLMDARASIVSNNLNRIMKTLTLITLGIMAPTLVVSAFSMNVPLPGGFGKHPLAFYIIIVLAALSVIGLILIQRKKGW